MNAAKPVNTLKRAEDKIIKKKKSCVHILGFKERLVIAPEEIKYELPDRGDPNELVLPCNKFKMRRVLLPSPKRELGVSSELDASKFREVHDSVRDMKEYLKKLDHRS